MDFETPITIVGAARNVAPTLFNVLKNLETVAEWFSAAKIGIFENDSEDDTAKILRAWQRPGRVLIQRSNLVQAMPQRTVRLAYARNELLAYARDQAAPLLLVVDLDEVFVKEPNREAFAAALATPGDWGAVAAGLCNGAYYDLWALRAPGILEYDCFFEGPRPDKAGEQIAALEAPLEVKSAFNGAALYRLGAIHPCCRYIGLSAGHESCEHVSFHACMRSHGAKMWIHPAFKI